MACIVDLWVSEHITQRVHLSPSARTRTDTRFVSQRSEGPRAFYRGWLPMFVRVVPVYMTYHPIYEHVRFWFGLGYLE